MSKNICALVMAAGYSVRYGSDKRFSGDEPLILRTLKPILSSFDSIYLVHRDNDEKLITLLENLPIHFIKASSDDICLGTSIAVGFEHIKNSNAEFESCAVFLADMPYINEKTITTLKSHPGKNSIIRPKFGTSSGHPVIFGNKFFEQLTEVQGQEGANSIIKKNIDYLKIVEVQDFGVIQDIDYPS